MRRSFPILTGLTLMLGACVDTTGLSRLTDPVYQSRRAAVEVEVKSNFQPILRDIVTGGGPALDGAYDSAGVPLGDRAARTVQLAGDLPLYESSPAALIGTLVLWGR